MRVYVRMYVGCAAVVDLLLLGLFLGCYWVVSIGLLIRFHREEVGRYVGR